MAKTHKLDPQSGTRLEEMFKSIKNEQRDAENHKNTFIIIAVVLLLSFLFSWIISTVMIKRNRQALEYFYREGEKEGFKQGFELGSAYKRKDSIPEPGFLDKKVDTASLKKTLDELIDEVDPILEENAQEFIKQYRQTGGE